MKITPRSNVLNRFNNVKNSKDLKIGDIIKGKVIKNENGLITLKTAEGKMITASFKSTENISEGSFISFIINQLNDEKAYGKLINLSGYDDESDITILLKQLGIENKELNEDIILSLLKYMQPIDKMKVEYVGLIQRSIDSLMQNKKEFLIFLIESEGKYFDLPLDELNMLFLSFKDDELNEISNNELLNANIIRESESGFLEDLLETFNLSENNIEELYNSSQRIVDSMEAMNLDTISYLLSKNTEITPQNILTIFNLISKDVGLSNYINIVKKIINELNDEELKSYTVKLSKLLMEAKEIDKETITGQFKELAKVAKEIEDIIKDKSIDNYELKSNLGNIKSNLHMIKTANDHMHYFNLPLLLNGNDATVEIFVYNEGKKNKKIDIKNVSILIALCLDNIGHLESLIQISNNHINVLFKTENKTVSNIILKNTDILKESLKSIGYSASISVTEKKIEKANLMSVEGKNLGNGKVKSKIDVRL